MVESSRIWATSYGDRVCLPKSLVAPEPRSARLLPRWWEGFPIFCMVLAATSLRRGPVSAPSLVLRAET